VLVLSLLGCARAISSRGSGGISGERAGFSGGGELLWEGDAELNRDFDNLAYTGAKWVRLDVDWKSVESSPGAWNWRFTDRVVNAARSRGIHVLLVPTYSPQWAREGACSNSMYCPPADPAWFANFVSATVSRYAPVGVHHYEIWNEPNWDPWWANGPNAAEYVRLLKPAYVSAHQADPGATVITGGLAPHGDLARDPSEPRSPVNFLKAIYAAGGQGYFDGFGIHPYPPLPNHPLSGTVGWNALLQTQTEHDIMAANGDGGKQIWGTEYGAPTGSNDRKAVSTGQQAQYVADGLRWWAAQSFTGPLFIHTVRDAPMNDPGDWHHRMGLLNNDFSPKPAFSVLTSLLH
jgi:aryl-phospho-beta-D-glucosidase BglC (GH1 family)